MARRRALDYDMRSGRPARSNVFNMLIIAGMVIVFLLVPLFITRSIIYLAPQQALGVLSLIGALVVVLLPLHDRPVNTRLFFYLLVLYVITYFCWPNWFALDLPFIPFITPGRVVLMALLTMWIFVVATSRPIHDRLWERLKPLAPVWIGLLVVLVFRALAIPFSPDRALATKAFLDIVTTFYIPLLIAVTVIESKRDVVLLLKVTVIVAIVIGLTVIYEARTEQNPFTVYLGSLVSYGGRWLQRIFSGDQRWGAYRAHGPFMVHLSMSEFFATTIPFILYWMESTKKVWLRVLLVAAIALALFCINATGSRAGMVASAFVLGVYLAIRGALFSSRKGTSDVRPLVTFAVLCLAMLVPLAIIYQLRKMGWDSAFGARGTRMIQITMGIPKILHRPFIGYGSSLSGIVLGYRANGRDLTIDNYFLSVALDAGLPGLIGFVTALFGLVYIAFRNAIRPGPHAGLYLAFFLYFLTFALVRVTLSEQGNLPVLHLMMGAFIAFHAIALKQTALTEKTSEQPQTERMGRRRRIWRLSRPIART